MKIIKEGKKIRGTMRVICNTCEAELEIQSDDLKKSLRDRPSDSSTYTYLCPCCQTINILGQNDLSEEIYLELKKR